MQMYVFIHATLKFPFTLRLMWENVLNYSNLPPFVEENRILQARQALRTKLRLEIWSCARLGVCIG